MIEIPYLDLVIEHTELSIDSVFLNSQGKIKLANTVQYLAN